jgi:hypothetical protein
MSSYNSPLPVGSDEATGAYAIAVGNTAGVATNNGNRTDSAQNVAPDFVWGNFPMQPNDERAAAVTPANISANSSGDYGWGATTRVASGRLNAALSNHAVAEAEWADYPSFFSAAGNYMVTAATGNGTTVTYTSQNNLQAGDVVNITGLTASAYNLSAATVASANALSFTVTNAANAGLITGQWYGKVESTTAASAADGAGIAYINVPSVLGETTANALDELQDAGYELANITTAQQLQTQLNNHSSFTHRYNSNHHLFRCWCQVPSWNKDYSCKPCVTRYSSQRYLHSYSSCYKHCLLHNHNFRSTHQQVHSLLLVFQVLLEQSRHSQSAAGTGSVATTATITITPYAAVS